MEVARRLGRGEVVGVIECGGLGERYAANCGRRRGLGSSPLRGSPFKAARLRLIAGGGRPTSGMDYEKATRAGEGAVSWSFVGEAPDYAVGPHETRAIDRYEWLLLTVGDVASVLDLTERAVRKRMSRGVLPATELGGSRYVRLALV